MQPVKQAMPFRLASKPARAAMTTTAKLQCHGTFPAAMHATRAPVFKTTPRKLSIRASSAQGASATSPPPAPVGVKPIPAAIAIGVGLLVKFIVPAPAGITAQAWSLFSIFLSTITGLVLEPLPVGAWAFLSVTAVLATRTLNFASAFSAMTNEVIWLIVISFFFAKGFEKTGLGERIANLFVKALGKSTLGLAYGLAAAETFISPAMPSTTARAGTHPRSLLAWLLNLSWRGACAAIVEVQYFELLPAVAGTS